MANAIYPNYKEALLSGDSNIALNSGTIRVSLIDTANNSFNANDTFYSDLDPADVIATATIANPTVVDGLFNGDDVTFSAVTGDQSEALLIWKDTGSANTSRLVAFLDTGVSGLPVTPNGSDIDIEWNVSGIFQL
jgi:hypothetical protein